jgi:hypothetical protein
MLKGFPFYEPYFKQFSLWNWKSNLPRPLTLFSSKGNPITTQSLWTLEIAFWVKKKTTSDTVTGLKECFCN